MKDSDILKTMLSRKLNVPPRLWTYAMLVGDARRRSNDGRRRDIGFTKGMHQYVDLIGAFAEVFVYHAFLTMGGSEELLSALRQNIFDPRGGTATSDVDLVVDGNRLDIKSFDCAPNKKFFAINKRKHHALAGKCDHYLCMLVPPFGKHAVLTNLVKWSSVSEWEERDFINSGNPALILPIEKFREQYLPYDGLDTGELHDKEEVRDMCDDAQLRHQLRSHFTGLEGWV